MDAEQIPAELVEAAAEAMAKHYGFPNAGYAYWDPARAALAAVYGEVQARGQVEAVRSMAKQMRHEAASVQPMTERGVGLWDAAAALDKIVGGPGQDVRHG